MKGPVGFNPVQESDKPLTPEQQQAKIRQLQDLLGSEASVMSRLDASLRAELAELEHVEHNLSSLREQVNSVNKMITERDRLVHELSVLVSEVETKINVETGFEYLSLVKRMDDYLSPALTKMNKELNRLFLHDLHDLYARDEQSRKLITVWSQEARVLYASLASTYGSLQGSQLLLSEIEKKLQLLSQSRKNPLEKSKILTGFNPGSGSP